MTTREFTKLLRKDREAAIHTVLLDFVNGCRDDGPEEIARVLTVWATRDEQLSNPRLDLG